MLAIDIKHLSKTYNNGFEALKGIDLEVKQGDFFALLGANGAGKSTTIGLITTLLSKTAGEVRIFNHDIDASTDEAKACIGLVPQEFNLNIFETCQSILMNQAGYYGITRSKAKPKVTALLHQLGLWEKRDTIVRQLSGGMKRRLMIARALIHEPKLLILDEPTAGVDIEIRRTMWDFLTQINEAGTTIILTTHYLEEAEQLCKNIAIIDKGHIVKHSSMKKLLKEFKHQTFVLNPRLALDTPPLIDGLSCQLADSHSLEVRIPSTMTMQEMFVALAAHGIDIVSMRNKTNRLEELFLDLINHDT